MADRATRRLLGVPGRRRPRRGQADRRRRRGALARGHRRRPRVDGPGLCAALRDRVGGAAGRGAAGGRAALSGQFGCGCGDDRVMDLQVAALRRAARPDGRLLGHGDVVAGVHAARPDRYGSTARSRVRRLRPGRPTRRVGSSRRPTRCPSCSRTTTLPDNGWDFAIRSGLAHRLRGQVADSFSAVEIAVRPRPPGIRPLATIVAALRDNAARLGFSELVAPVRPNGKADVDEPMSGYALRIRADGLPVDPSLRVHVRAGGPSTRCAPRSMVVPGTVEEWREWTGWRSTGPAQSSCPGPSRRCSAMSSTDGRLRRAQRLGRHPTGGQRPGAANRLAHLVDAERDEGKGDDDHEHVGVQLLRHSTGVRSVLSSHSRVTARNGMKNAPSTP